ncbi:hypothetical protein M430DRAFT_256113 [Amorphotheca resinae ATCC 22711]|uniref:Uncharacterized protein n=1 Tax=Amorphotheca resinae ATCC 22711 TaxID=857342 RepID=A0A2T3AYA8_AMORE|nr:hypothetical protein M430DRAFT_256113 [Amorphotheca resinae ATCC 22711]PSS15043.1 hypothetical protein M430DRAFT_256113 [Amorphotheca resinae ATCC 22711]
MYISFSSLSKKNLSKVLRPSSSLMTADSLLRRITVWTMTKGGPEAVEPVVYLPSFSVGVILAYFIIRYLKTLHLRQNIAIS